MRLFLIAAIALAAQGRVRADQYDLGALVGGTALVPKPSVARAYGGDLGLAIVTKPRARGLFVFPALDGFAVVSDGEDGKTARDLFGLHVSMSFGWLPTSWIGPFAGAGLDALVVTTDGRAGVTLGADLRAGLLGHLGSRLLYTVTASYLGAVAPHVGDNAGGLVVGVSLGWRLTDDPW